MNFDAFMKQKRPSWQYLETLLAQAEHPSQLSAQEIDELGRLYRATTSDLAVAQRDYPGHKVTRYLNQLVGQAHAAIYREEPLRWQRLRHFYSHTFPGLYRELLPYTTVAFVLFSLAGLLSFLAVRQQTEVIYLLEGPGIRGMVRQVEAGKLWTEIAPAARSAVSAFILTNNIQVTFLAFAGGITAGLLTAWIMLMNGVHLGAVFGLLQAHGLAMGLLDFVVAHGFIELSVIFVAGGSGLYMGDALLRPGLLTRRTALTLRARQAAILIVGCMPLLILAGFIEGFISPSGLPFAVKLAIGASSGIALHYYWLRWGRTSKQVRPGKDSTAPDSVTSPA